jgi:hypothetical protein
MSYKDLKQPLAAGSPSTPKYEPKRDEPANTPADAKPETTDPKQGPQVEGASPDMSGAEPKTM